MKRILFFENQQRRFVADALVRALTVILHFPQPMLITTFFRTSETKLRKAFFVIRAVAALDDAVAPRTRASNQSVHPARRFNRFGKACLALRMRRVSHRKVHRIIRERYEKGGRLSNAL